MVRSVVAGWSATAGSGLFPGGSFVIAVRRRSRLRPGQLLRVGQWLGVGRRGRTRLRRLSGLDPRTTSMSASRVLITVVERHPWAARICVPAVGLVGGGFAGGPVAAVIAAVYAWVAVSAILRRRRDETDRVAAADATDGLVALTAELRSGADPSTATAAVLPMIGAAGSSVRAWPICWIVSRTTSARPRSPGHSRPPRQPDSRRRHGCWPDCRSPASPWATPSVHIRCTSCCTHRSERPVPVSLSRCR
jgi:hypothetical protein